MSHYKVRSMSFNKTKGVVKASGYDNNVVPAYYYPVEISKEKFDGSVEDLLLYIYNLLEGREFQFLNSASSNMKISFIISELFEVDVLQETLGKNINLHLYISSSLNKYDFFNYGSFNELFEDIIKQELEIDPNNIPKDITSGDLPYMFFSFIDIIKHTGGSYHNFLEYMKLQEYKKQMWIALVQKGRFAQEFTKEKYRLQYNGYYIAFKSNGKFRYSDNHAYSLKHLINYFGMHSYNCLYDETFKVNDMSTDEMLTIPDMLEKLDIEINDMSINDIYNDFDFHIVAEDEYDYLKDEYEKLKNLYKSKGLYFLRKAIKALDL